MEPEAPVGPSPPQVHIVFAIDFSSSMKKRDVKSQNSKKISRWDAVFCCMKEFLADQQEQDKENSASVSLIVFNDEATTLLERMPLRDGKKVEKALETAHRMNCPRGGTGFAAGFELAHHLLQKNNNTNKDEKVVVVFLSDGRPGDLQVDPPKHAGLAMQTHFRRKKRSFPAVGFHIEQMQSKHQENLSLHFICLYNSENRYVLCAKDNSNHAQNGVRILSKLALCF